MDEPNEESSMVVEELAIVGGRRISVTTSRRISVQRSSVSSMGSLPSFEYLQSSAVVNAPAAVGESPESSDELDSSDESVESEDEGYAPVSPQLQIETSPQSNTVEEFIDPGSEVMYETKDHVMPSAPVSLQSSIFSSE